MKFTIERDALADVLFRVQGVCSQKSTLAILSSCLIEAHEDGRITVQGTDLDVAITTQAQADVEEPGRIALAARRLFDTVKSISSGKVTIETEPNHWAVLDAGTIHARIAGSHPEEFPQLTGVAEKQPMEIPADLLLDMIEKVFFSISTDEARASFNGAFLRLVDDKLQMVATDGHRLSKIEVPQPDIKSAPERLSEGIIVPRKGLAELKRVLSADATIGLGQENDDLHVVYDGTTLAIRLIPGRFPNFTKVIPNELPHKALINKADLLAALKRAAFYTAKMGNTRLTLSNGTIEVYAFDPEAGELREPVPCDYEGEEVSAGYNYRYLLDVLGAVDGDQVWFEVINTKSPTVVRDPERDDTLFIVMPMQI